MTINKLPLKLQKVVSVMVFLAAIGLLAVSSNALKSVKSNVEVVDLEVNAGNIHMTEEIVLPN